MLADTGYTIRAYWPNAAMEPEHVYVRSWREGVYRLLEMTAEGKYMTIQLLTPDSLALFQSWGQIGKDWP